MRILIAGILGGIAMYVWATIAHLSPLAMIGTGVLPNDAPAVAALQSSLGPRSGVYFFPSGGMTGDAKAQAAYDAKIKTTAQGIVVYKPPGTPAMTPAQLITEAVLEIGESILLALALGMAGPRGFGGRLGIAAIVGLIAAVSTNASYWNWYGYGLDYTLANGLIELVKYVVAGAVIALVLGWRRRSAA